MRTTAITHVFVAMLGLMAWQLAVQLGGISDFFFSSPLQILRRMISELLGLEIYVHFFATLRVVLAALVVGSIVGTILGVVLAGHSRAAAIANPYLTALGAIPPVALAPMFIVWFGTGFVAKFAITMFPVSIVATVQAFAGARRVQEGLLLVAQGLKYTPIERFKKIILPSGLNWVAVGAKINIGTAILGAFIAEFINADYGLGRFIMKAAGLYDVAGVLCGIALLICMSQLIDLVLGQVLARVAPWLD